MSKRTESSADDRPLWAQYFDLLEQDEQVKREEETRCKRLADRQKGLLRRQFADLVRQGVDACRLPAVPGIPAGATVAVYMATDASTLRSSGIRNALATLDKAKTASGAESVAEFHSAITRGAIAVSPEVAEAVADAVADAVAA